MELGEGLGEKTSASPPYLYTSHPLREHRLCLFYCLALISCAHLQPADIQQGSVSGAEKILKAKSRKLIKGAG